ncbi:MAG TPA: hypothetical protein VG389_01320 [Myxococcota bacterium]|nr:hypothetical protein [Myxococcota bacterium]
MPPASSAPARFALSPVSRVLVGLAAAAAGAAVLASARLEALETRTLLPPEPEAAPLVGRHVARMAALGYTDFAADLAWVQAVLYYGSHWVVGSDLRWLDHYIETTIDLDPSFRHVYQWAGVVTMYNARRITNRSVEASTFFLKRGYERFPDYWEFPFMIGFNYYFELQTKSPGQKKAWQRMGAEYFRAASLLEGAPSWLGLLAVSSLDKFAERRMAVLHLQELLDATDDPKLRRELERRLTALEDETTARERLRLDAAFRRAHLAAFPYVPSALYGLLAPQTDAPSTVRTAFEATLPPAGEP